MMDTCFMRVKFWLIVCSSYSIVCMNNRSVYSKYRKVGRSDEYG